MRILSRRFAVLPATAVTGLIMLTGCSGAVRVAAPTTTGAVAAQCRASPARLPQTLLGEKRRSTSPASADTAAWGDPAITLRCGVSEPGAMNPGSPQYDPKQTSSVAVESGGVCWLTQTPGDGGFRFTTVKQQAFVEVDVPSAYSGQGWPMPALNGAVLKADPASPDSVFDCR